MACCGDNMGAETLEGVGFEDIVFNIGEEKIKFVAEEDKGGEYVRSGGEIKADNSEENQKILMEKKKLNEEISLKDKRIYELRAKIDEIDKKIAAMEQILTIDVSEKEYVIALGEQMRGNLPQDNNH
ncbi:MAG: DUF724 domain-containing protein [archaeon]|nr:DUF724 domain-containing protein [archaeon]